MNIEDHDNTMIYCRMLGHEVLFFYCRHGVMSQPCRKILDCWFHTFDIEQFIREHFTEDQIKAFLAPPKPKVTTLIELIQQAQESAKKPNSER